MCVQGGAQDAVKQCTVMQEPVGQWDMYSTTLASPAAFAVSPVFVVFSCEELLYFTEEVPK